MAKGKYQDWLTEKGLLLIEGWARDGLTYEQIARNMGVNKDTLNSWKKKYPVVSVALKKGRQVVIRELENALIKRAKGYEYEEIMHEQNKDGLSVRKTLKQVVPDTTALIFALKNMDPEHWRDRRESKIEKQEKLIRIEKLKVEAEALRAVKDHAEKSVGMLQLVDSLNRAHRARDEEAEED